MEALLITLVGVLVAGVITGVGFIVRMVFNHDKADAVLTEKVVALDKRMDGFDTRMDRLDKGVDDGFASVNDRLDRLLERAA